MVQTMKLELRWADLDPNYHVRHSVYYDWGATARTHFLFANGMNTKVLMQHHFGPVIFREEAIFRREIHFGDTLFINLKISKLRRDFSRFSFRHEITKEDGTLCATINIDGAWIDTQTRKLIVPPPMAIETFNKLPLSDDFEWQEIKA